MEYNEKSRVLINCLSKQTKLRNETKIPQVGFQEFFIQHDCFFCLFFFFFFFGGGYDSTWTAFHETVLSISSVTCALKPLLNVIDAFQ